MGPSVTHEHNGNPVLLEEMFYYPLDHVNHVALLDIFMPGKLNYIREEGGFPWESIIVEAQHLGYSTYLIFGNTIPMDLRIVYTVLKRTGKMHDVRVRRGFTYHQLLTVVKELEKYNDMVIFFHDPVAFSDLRGDEKHTLMVSLSYLLARYAETFNSVCIFASGEELKLPVDIYRIKATNVQYGWMIEAQGMRRYIYRDPRQVSIDYFAEV